GISLGGYLAIRMASHDPRVRAVAALSPCHSADIYWNVTLASLRRELAALYQVNEQEMANAVPRITLSHALPHLRAPLLVVGGGPPPSTRPIRASPRSRRTPPTSFRFSPAFHVIELSLNDNPLTGWSD